jgi:hypothetical protein
MILRIKRLLFVVFAPVLRWIVRLIHEDDPWQRSNHRVPVQRFGPGSLREFQWYFQGDSTVQVQSVEEICAWLAECQYVHDKELFNETDFWQHPRTFEYLRRGDCEDHALWAWRKLLGLNIQAEFISGETLKEEGCRGHCWVHVRMKEGEFMFEATAKDAASMLFPLEEARSGYRPHFAVDGSFRSYAYAGYFHWLRERLDTDRERRRARLSAWLRRIVSRGRPDDGSAPAQ